MDPSKYKHEVIIALCPYSTDQYNPHWRAGFEQALTHPERTEPEGNVTDIELQGFRYCVHLRNLLNSKGESI